MAFGDEFAQAFYQWESKLRGWDVYPYTIELEPPLIPLYAYLAPSRPVIDDGRHETVLSSLTDKVSGLFKPKQNPEIADDSITECQHNDIPDTFMLPDEKYCTFHIALPPDHTGSLIAYKNLLQSLRYAQYHLSFEIIGAENQIVIQLGAWHTDSKKLLDQIRAHLPEATVSEQTDAINPNIFSDQTLVVDFGLEHEVMCPLHTITELKNDPLTALIGSMDALIEREQCIFQILFTHTNAQWERDLYDCVTDAEGKSLFADGHNLVTSAKEKTASALYACVMRIAVVSHSEQRRWELVKSIGGTLAQYDAPKSNNLMPLDNEGYDHYDHWRDVVERTTHRSGMLLSLDELVGLLHYPDEVVKSEKLSRQRIKTKAPPDLAIGHELILGENEHRGNTTQVSLSSAQRTRHMYVVGASGTGKSTLLLNCIKQDMENNQGICVLDPHGDLIDQALAFIPERRIKDVILLDPSDEHYPIGLNIFDAHTNLEKTLLASDLTAVFERLSTTWGDQMSTVLSQGVLAMLESTKSATLHDLRRFLIERDFRNEFLESVQDQEVVYYWHKQFPLLSGRPQASVLTRLDTFLRPKPIRYMVSQRKSAIDFARVMDEGKILLAKLSHGGIGEENSYLLGALLASKIHQTALSRQSVSQEQRRPFWLYIDEFQNFLTPSIAQTLSGARKYSLGMILAHQELTQLSLHNKAIAASVIANPYTRICFRMGDRDARTLSEGFSTFDSKDLQSLGIGEAIGRIEQANYDFSLTTYPLTDVDPKLAQERQEAVREASRVTYATPLAEVEALFARPQAIGAKIRSSQSAEKSGETDTVHKVVAKENERPAKQSQTKNQPDQKGKGGNRHKEIQQLLQKAAHERGFGATIEHHIGEGSHIDLVIDTGEKKIACEISVSTSVEHEVGNIRKCLSAGFDGAFVVSEDAGHLERIKASAKNTFPESDFTSLAFLSSDEMIGNVQALAVPKTTTIIRGYHVKQGWREPDQAERKRREVVFAKIVRA